MAAEAGLGAAQTGREAARQAVHAAQGKTGEAQSAMVALSTRLRTLQEMEAAQEGYFAGVKAVFEAKKHDALSGEFTVVADAFEAPAGYETALETALAASLQDIITDTEDAAKAAIAYLHEHRAGRATFLPLDRMRPGRDTLDLRQAMGLPRRARGRPGHCFFPPEISGPRWTYCWAACSSARLWTMPCGRLMPRRAGTGLSR